MKPIRQIVDEYKNAEPEIVFEWRDNKDYDTGAIGWVVINSLRGGAAGGGTRMSTKVSREEVKSLAKTMEIKFTVSGPNIGGAKSGINFNENDPRKYEVLERWYKAISPLLKSYLGTGGDLNVSDDDCISIAGKFGVRDPQEGIVIAHGNYFIEPIVNQLMSGVKMQINDIDFAPKNDGSYKVNDMITGYGVVQSLISYYEIFDETQDIKDKKIILQGWGNVGRSTGYFLAKNNAKVVGISDKDGCVLNDNGFSFEEIENLFINSNHGIIKSNLKIKDNAKIFDVNADVFIPCADSCVITKDHLDKLRNNGVKIICCGANVPFVGQQNGNLYSEIAEYADKRFIVIPDFIANCGMAHTFAFLMKYRADVRDKSIFKSVSKTISGALREIRITYPDINNTLLEYAIRISLKKLGYKD